MTDVVALAASATASSPSSFGDLIAAEIRAELARRQLPHNALAAALNTSPNWVSRRLRGRTPFDVDELDQVAHFLGVSLAELLTPAVQARDSAHQAREIKPT